MAPYADPRHCPECGAELTLGATECPSCGLSLSGPVAARLYSTLEQADRLLEELQHPSEASTAPPRSALPPLPGAPKPKSAPKAHESPAEERQGVVPAAEPAHEPGTITGRQVPRILLTLGAACLLGAAVIFLAVSWTRLGVGGRTAVLLGMTAVGAAMAAWAAHRRLTAALEAFGVITLGLWALDLFGAGTAGWVGHFDQAEILLGVGAVLIVTGTVTAIVVRLLTGVAFRAGEAFAVLGAVAYSTGLVTLEAMPVEQGLVVALLGTIVTAQAATAFRLPVAVAGGTATSLVVWVALVWRGTELGLVTPGVHKLWLQGHGWPLMVAAVLPWLPAFAQALPRRAREILVGIGGIPVLLLVGLPTLNYSPTRMLVVGLAVLAASACLVRVAPPPIGSGWVIPTAVVLVAGSVLAVDYAGLGVRRIAGAAARLYGGRADGSLTPMLIPDRVPDPAFAGLLSLVLFVAAWAVLGRLWTRAPRELPGRAVTAVVAVMSWLGAITLDLPVWTWVASGVLLAAGLAVDTARSHRPVTAWAGAGVLAATVTVSVYSAPLNLLAAGAGVLLAGLLALTDSRALVRGASSAVGAMLIVDAIWSVRWWVTGTSQPGTALLASCTMGLMVAGLAGPAGHSRTRGGWLPVWYGVAVGAVLSWPALGLAGVAAASPGSRAQWAAAYLTTAGASLVAAGLLARRHRSLAPTGTALLALAWWVSLWDLGVGTPEAYTIPWAVLLLAAGTFRVLRRGGSTLRDLTPGLALGLVPSLLWVLADPESLRALVLGVACLGLVLFGVRARWSAPLLFGSGAGLIEVIRLAAPYAAQAIPRWVLIGTAGALLLVVGVTWERRLAQARVALRYVTRLR